MIINVETKNAKLNKDYEIVIEDDLLKDIEKYIDFPYNTLIVTDTNIPESYINQITKN